ncbi:rod-determining factor RdfA [Haloarcula japonica]|uniref:rod-determining factor RdfA n=1 Tax=Haloarcula japonica TaxID=29282 RepID=UPI0039F68788
MTSADDDQSSSRGRSSKVARLIEQYGLQGIGPQLEELWTTDDPDRRRSLRSLAEFFNRQLLKQELEQADMQTLDGEVENTFRLLTDESVSQANQTRVRRQLEREGIDVDQLKDDFVSYQSMRTYLTKYRDATYDNDAEPVASTKRMVQRLQSRVSNVIETKIAALKKSGAVSLDEFQVIVDVRVICERCGTQKDVISLLDDRKCDCTQLGDE